MLKITKILGDIFQIILYIFMSIVLVLEAIFSLATFKPSSTLAPDVKSFLPFANVIYVLILGLIIAFFYFQVKTKGFKRLIWCGSLFVIINLVFLPLTFYSVNLGR